MSGGVFIRIIKNYFDLKFFVALLLVLESHLLQFGKHLPFLMFDIYEQSNLAFQQLLSKGFQSIEF